MFLLICLFPYKQKYSVYAVGIQVITTFFIGRVVIH